MKKMRLLPLLSVLVLSCFVHSCGTKTHQKAESDKPLNISVFLDLSDRLTVPGQPTQMSKDTAIVNNIVDYFYRSSLTGKLLKCDNHLKIFFYPAPNDGKICLLSDALDIDLSKKVGAEKRTALDNMKKTITESLSQIYSTTLTSQNWIGSDIWGFFSDHKIDQFMRKGNRNIMIILSDGYIYDKNDIQNQGNACSYISSTTLSKKQNLIVKRKELGDLEVLMMEINPKNIQDKNQMSSTISSWFKAMGVKKVSVMETDLPSNTSNALSEFLK